MNKHITIIGAGMGGTFLAILLAKKNNTVDLYEERPDIRKIPPSSDRSINQSLSLRGIRILEETGLWPEIKKITLTEKGRTVHTIEGSSFFSPYGKSATEVHHTFSRTTLNSTLLDLAQAEKNITIHFHTRCTGIDKKTRVIQLHNTKTGKRYNQTTDIVLGADGVHSIVRTTLEKQKRTESKKIQLDLGYKSVHIPDSHRILQSLSRETFHMWPRENCFLFAIPNRNGSFIFTIILPMDGEAGFSELLKQNRMRDFVRKNFPDVASLATPLAEGFKKNRQGHLECLYTSCWHDGAFSTMIGDACHAIMPFYGQGISATFEDCMALVDCIERYAPDWNTAFTAYQASRKPHTDVVTDLSIQRFYELKDGFRSKHYLAKQAIESALSRYIPFLWKPLYSWITHTSIPYAEAYRRYTTQQRIARLLGMDLWINLYARFMQTTQ